MQNYFCTEIEKADLPLLFLRGSQLTDQPAQQDMLQLALLTAMSYALPNCVIEHGVPSHTYHPNLMSLVLAPPASGKGVMNLARRILRTIQAEKRSEYDRLALIFSMQGLETPEKTAFIPGNSSSAAFFKILSDNDGQGIMLETEMDVISAAWKHDYANYSYAFRQAYEHETISKSRKKAGEEFLEIKDPQLSVLLSGTYNQLLPLMESRENGLASRFLCYVVDDIIPFDNRAIHHPDDQSMTDANDILEQMDEEVAAIYHWLKQQDHDCVFQLTGEQATEMRNFFDDGYKLAFNSFEMPIEFDPVVKRHAVNMLRIACILTIVRWWEEQSRQLGANYDGELPTSITCDEHSFRVMISMAEILLIHAGKMLLMLPDVSGETIVLDHNQELLSHVGERFTTAEILAAGKQLGISQRSVERCLKQMKEQGTVRLLQHGQYLKI